MGNNVENIRGITIIHNGYKIEFVNSMEEVEKYINNVLAPHRSLNPKKIFDRVVVKDNERKKATKLIRYKYYTLYEEDFILDIEYK